MAQNQENLRSSAVQKSTTSVNEIEFFLLQNTHLKAYINNSLDIIRRSLELYPPSKTAISFNGGKDACTVLYLVRAVLDEIAISRGIESQTLAQSIKIVYFVKSDEFPQVREFIDDLTERLGFNLILLQDSYKEGMIRLVKEFDVSAVFMGLRDVDPHGKNAEHFQPSSKGWIPFMRIYPILTWKYSCVWQFLRGLNLMYCTLYDQGYTSLGSVKNTKPNPALKSLDGNYRPAYELDDQTLERVNRYENTNLDEEQLRKVDGKEKNSENEQKETDFKTKIENCGLIAFSDSYHKIQRVLDPEALLQLFGPENALSNIVVLHTGFKFLDDIVQNFFVKYTHVVIYGPCIFEKADTNEITFHINLQSLQKETNNYSRIDTPSYSILKYKNIWIVSTNNHSSSVVVPTTENISSISDILLNSQDASFYQNLIRFCDAQTNFDLKLHHNVSTSTENEEKS